MYPLLFLVACTSPSADTDPVQTVGPTGIVLTVAADYTAAAVAEVTLDARAVRDTLAPTSTDPLNLAVQKAWRAGIAVVVSASNRGPRPGTISKPGDDPLVITSAASTTGRRPRSTTYCA